jgi:hypothetical protein
MQIHNELDKDISFTPHQYVLCCVFAVTILFIVNDFVLLMGLKKNHPIIMRIWLLIGGINRVVRMLICFKFCCNKYILRYKLRKFAIISF